MPPGAVRIFLFSPKSESPLGYVHDVNLLELTWVFDFTRHPRRRPIESEIEWTRAEKAKRQKGQAGKFHTRLPYHLIIPISGSNAYLVDARI